jgi:hypothetical protein
MFFRKEHTPATPTNVGGPGSQINRPFLGIDHSVDATRVAQILGGSLKVDQGPIHQAVNHFSAQLGGPPYTVYADLTVSTMGNALVSYLGSGRSTQQADVHYDPRFVSQIVARYGWGALWGVLAHEVGHAHLGMFSRYVRDYTDENSADYIAGFLLCKNGINLEPFMRLLHEVNVDDGEHPNTATRLRTIMQGYQDCQRNQNRIFERFLINRHRWV